MIFKIQKIISSRLFLRFQSKIFKMKNAILFLLLIFQFTNLTAQRNKPKVPDFQFGIRTGNHITVPSIDVDENFKHKSLLRYSAGILFRKTIRQMKPRRRIGFGTARRGVLAIDFGVNAVATGYHFQIGNIVEIRDLINWEFPIMLVVYDRENFMIPSSWRRKGLTTYGRFGPKFSNGYDIVFEHDVKKNDESLYGSIGSGNWNFLWSINAGIIQNHKSGNTSFVEIGWNQGFIASARGDLYYSNSNDSKQGQFAFRGSYVSINVGFLLAPKNLKYIPIGKGKLPKTIFNPRYL